MLTLIVTEAGGGGRLEVIFTFLFMHVHDFHLCITFIARQNNKAISIFEKNMYEKNCDDKKRYCLKTF